MGKPSGKRDRASHFRTEEKIMETEEKEEHLEDRFKDLRPNFKRDGVLWKHLN